MMKFAALALAVGLSTAVAPSLRAQIDAEAMYWFATPEGTGSVGIDGIEGTEFDVQDDLGYEDAEGMLGVNLYLGDKHQFGVNYLRLDASAHNTLSTDIRYQDLVFRVSTDVASSLEATLIRGVYRMNLGDGDLRGGLILGGQYLDMEGNIEAEDVGQAYAQIKVGMPVVGGHVRYDAAEWISLRGSVSGLSLGIADVDATYWDAEVSALLTWAHGPFAGAGYRHLVIDADDSSEQVIVDLTFTGPFLVAGFAW